MQFIEVREDWFTGRTSIIASARSGRPHLVAATPPTAGRTCPFCPGNEDMTPPAEAVMVSTDVGHAIRTGDDAVDARGWNVRVFSNLFPAFSADVGSGSAYGHHLIVVESPHHDKDIDQIEKAEVEMYLSVLSFEVERLNSDHRVNCVSIFKNQGEEAGASIPHPHTQIVASHLVPPQIVTETRAWSNVWSERRESAISLLAQEAEKEGRVVMNRLGYVAFVPFAPMVPFELWIAPDKPHRSIEDGKWPGAFSEVLRLMISAVKRVHGEVAYNLYWHLPPKSAEGFHWHVELVPRTSKMAGYELGFGAYVITTRPEDAAQLYRQTL